MNGVLVIDYKPFNFLFMDGMNIFLIFFLELNLAVIALFVWLISHQPTVLFSQNKPATSNQPALLSYRNKSAPVISHQPNEQTQ
jgi:hypothetical protein